MDKKEELKAINTLSPEETSWNKMVETVNQLIKRVNGQSALIQLQKDEIDKLKDWQKEVERVYPFTVDAIGKEVEVKEIDKDFYSSDKGKWLDGTERGGGSTYTFVLN